MLEAKETTLILCDYGKLRGTHCHTSLNENYSLLLGCCIQLAARLRCTTQPLMTMCACMYLGAGCHRHGRWYQADSLHRWGWFLPYSPSCFQKRVMNLDMNMRHTHTHTVLTFIERHMINIPSGTAKTVMAWRPETPLQSYIMQVCLGLQVQINSPWGPTISTYPHSLCNNFCLLCWNTFSSQVCVISS